jgi:glycosyltransferase involved in cell wall biosynthesis
MKILHCLAQLPNRTGSGVYYKNLIREIKKQRGWKQAGLYALNGENRCLDLDLDYIYPIRFNSDELPFPIAGMSDEMPYDSTAYSRMTPDMMEQWKGAFTSKLIEIKDDFKPDVIVCHHLWILCALVLDVFPDIPVIAISHGTDIRQRCCDLFVFPSYYEGMGLIAIEALASGLHLVSNMLPGLREQLGRELVEDPAISWVELPPLKNLDEIVDSARHEYIESLAEAICFQIERLKTEGGTGDFPFDKIASCSWDCLVSKIISVIESVI